ncbi:DUF4231 domain-containing protein [Candidatus Nitrospira neomarina]|uniref:DUF4231 domain-containing protein n=1 Tax=Candidatus Nitrospira neomarina TaxID=3020899 RepID=A0AA96K0P2_9BACT|nr:DUF4231 domain-containing protein [Candidatus Nitrospira neomarina]WNM62266.1 DUF4231 domain-containing protein [Candidatus Nitrospira neomarina]
MAMAEAEYLEQRLDDQINWYGRKSAANQTAYKGLRLIEIIAAAAIPLLAGYSQTSGYVGMTIGVLGLIVAVLAGIVSLYRFQENWNEYRAVAESLKQEKFLYLARAEPYRGDQPFELLVQRVETILKSETTGWAQAMRAAGAADKAARERQTNLTE